MTRQQASIEQWNSAVEYAKATLRPLLNREPDQATIERVATGALEAIPRPITKAEILRDEESRMGQEEAQLV